MKGTNLEYLFDLFPKKSNSWNIEQVREFLSDVQSSAKEDDVFGRVATPEIVAKAAKKHGFSLNNAMNMVKELKKASATGYTLESYFKAGRPYRAGQKVIVNKGIKK